jgi:hypothetical protein
MEIKTTNLQSLGFIQDETFDTLFTLKNCPLEFKLTDGDLYAGQDLALPEDSNVVFFKVDSVENLERFLSSVVMSDFLNVNLSDHAEG